MKKIASVFTASALAFGLVACAKVEEKKPEPKAEAPKVVEEKPAQTGATGAPGAPGAPGAQGAQGAQGAPGAPGAPAPATPATK